VPDNRVLNAYFTKKNLLTDKDFVVEVKCSSDSAVLISQELVNPFYKSTSWVANRAVWLKNDLAYIGFGILILILLFVSAIMIYRSTGGFRR